MKTFTRHNNDHLYDYVFCPHYGNSFGQERLFRSRQKWKLLKMYRGVGPNIVRVLAALATLCLGVIPGLIVYLSFTIIPKK